MTDHGKLPSPRFNVGIDCEDIARWRKMLPKIEAGVQKKLFSAGEHRYCRSYKDPAPHYAVRWCAKEALLKACSPFYKLDLRKIEVANAEDGSPFIILNDPEAESLNLTVKVSMSHSKETAIAIVAVAKL